MAFSMKPGLKMRVLTAVIGIPVIIAVLLAPVWVMLAAVVVCSIIGIFEFYGAVNIRKKMPLLCILGYIASVIIPLCVFLEPIQILTCSVAYLIILFLVMLTSGRKIMFTDISLAVMGLIYIPFMLSHVLFTRQTEFGNIIVWLIFLGSFMTDSCAFFVGKALGKHKLCPNISPKKTIEGAVGGVIGCGLAFLLFAYIVNTFFGKWLDGFTMSYIRTFSLGLISAAAAQIGDLTASIVKRQFGIKDFGNMFPGHGGMLDRCDSIILVAPVIFLFVSQISLFV